jgi:hypothetical protein
MGGIAQQRDVSYGQLGAQDKAKGIKKGLRKQSIPQKHWSAYLRGRGIYGRSKKADSRSGFFEQFDLMKSIQRILGGKN